MCLRVSTLGSHCLLSLLIRVTLRSVICCSYRPSNNLISSRRDLTQDCHAYLARCSSTIPLDLAWLHGWLATFFHFRQRSRGRHVDTHHSAARWVPAVCCDTLQATKSSESANRLIRVPDTILHRNCHACFVAREASKISFLNILDSRLQELSTSKQGCGIPSWPVLSRRIDEVTGIWLRSFLIDTTTISHQKCRSTAVAHGSGLLLQKLLLSHVAGRRNDVRLPPLHASRVAGALAGVQFHRVNQRLLPW